MYEKLNFSKRLREGINRLVDKGPFKINSGGKITAEAVQGARPMPWIFINHDARKKFCWFWNQVCTQEFNHIPTHCRFACWKTVIKPATVKQTFECLDILQALNLPSKIGMDLRDYTYGAWAGFVYADSLEEGQKYYKLIRDKIPKFIPVFLKRGCTEMERLISSDKWDDISENDYKIEQQLHDLFCFEERYYYQAAWYKQEIKENWIKHAIKIGDPTAKETAELYCDDPEIWNKLVVQSVQYQKENNNGDS